MRRRLTTTGSLVHWTAALACTQPSSVTLKCLPRPLALLSGPSSLLQANVLCVAEFNVIISSQLINWIKSNCGCASKSAAPCLWSESLCACKRYQFGNGVRLQCKMARDYDHLFKLLIIGDSGEYGRGFTHMHARMQIAYRTHELSLRWFTNALCELW